MTLAAVVTEIATTVCRACGESKPDADFYVGRHGKLMLDCKRCHNAKVVAARKRKAMLLSAALESARHFMACNLVAERLGQRASPTRPGSVDAYDQAAMFSLDALQTLRDCLASQRRGRR